MILRREASYRFLHDRVQEASYALIPEGERAAAHLRIGRVLLASMSADSLTEHLFDVANQFNRGAALLIDHDEKIHMAAINLNAGRKEGVRGLRVRTRIFFSRQGTVGSNGLGQSVPVDVRPVARMCGV